MLNLIIPLFSVLLAFLSSLSSIRYFLTRRGRVYWIIPFFISIILFYQNTKVLIHYASGEEIFPITFDNLLNLAQAILWYAFVEAFNFALKTEREENKYLDESRSTYNEARFLTLMEERETKKEIKERKLNAENKSRKFNIPKYNFPPERK